MNASAGIQYRVGDATAPVGDGPRIIAHVCNDVRAWGCGFVLAVSARWPQPEREYRAWGAGRLQQPYALGEVQFVEVGPGLHVASMIAQRGIGRPGGGPPIRYEALEKCLATVAEEARRLHAGVHMPRIGCGLAGGRWSEVESIIQRTLCASAIPVTVYDFDA